jgi:hypothetical protein
MERSAFLLQESDRPVNLLGTCRWGEFPIGLSQPDTPSVVAPLVNAIKIGVANKNLKYRKQQ